MKSSKWSAVLILFTIATVLLAACSGGGNETSPSSSAPASNNNQSSATPGGKTELTVRISWSEVALPNIQELTDEFNNSQDKIKVNLEFVAGNEAGRQKLASEFVAGNPPEVVQIWKKTANDYIEQGLLHDMSDLFEEAGWNENYFNAGAMRWGVSIMDATSENPPKYGIPDFFQPSVIYYNKPIFERLNLQEPTTLDELIEISGKIRDAGIIPLVFNGAETNSVDMFSKIQAQITGVQKLLDINAGKAKYTDPEMIEVAKLIERMITSRVIDPVSVGLDVNAAISMMGTGQAAMMSMNSSLVPNFEQIKEADPTFDYDVFKELNFTANPVSKYSVTFGGVWFIPKANKHIPETYEYLKFLFNADNAKKMARAAGRISNVESANGNIDNPVINKIYENMMGATNVEAFYAIDVIPNRMIDALTAGIQEMLNGNVDAETMMANAQKEMDAILAGN